MGRLAAYALAVVVLGTAASQAAPSRQALRTCVDRWNQANMVGVACGSAGWTRFSRFVISRRF